MHDDTEMLVAGECREYVAGDVFVFELGEFVWVGLHGLPRMAVRSGGQTMLFFSQVSHISQAGETCRGGVTWPGFPAILPEPGLPESRSKLKGWIFCCWKAEPTTPI